MKNPQEYIKSCIMPLIIFLLLLVVGIKNFEWPVWIINLLPPNRLIAMVIILAILLTLSLSSLYKIKKLKLKFGIYWDKNKEPHCPICKKPLSFGLFYIPTQDINDYVFRCIGCNKFIPCTNNGKNINLEEAKKLMNYPEASLEVSKNHQKSTNCQVLESGYICPERAI